MAFCVLRILGLFVRVLREEQMMLGELGSEYAAYMRQTDRFFFRFSRAG